MGANDRMLTSQLFHLMQIHSFDDSVIRYGINLSGFVIRCIIAKTALTRCIICFTSNIRGADQNN